MTRQAIAESLLGEIRWEDASTGFCRCPGIDLHSNDNAPKDCIIHIDGAPNVYCVHSSCKAIIDETSHKLQSEFGSAERGETGSTQRWQPSRADLERKAKAERAERLRKAAEDRLPVILRDHATTYQELSHRSPTSLVGVPDLDLWRQLLRLFQSEDILWIGDKLDSGSPHHARHFRHTGEWLTSPACPGPRIVPSTFKAGVYSRSATNIQKHRFLVVENDRLGINDQCAVLSYLGQWCRLRAVAFSGRRSLHGWFDMPDDALRERLELILPPWGVDSAGFRPAQPFRMPGCINEKSGRYADLLYLDVEVTP